ncbi:MAG: DNA gyrase inhibitor YacG [Magnetospiraceae bacterium]
MTKKTGKVIALKDRRPGGKCPICRKKSVPDYRPFCSKRCADIDLGNWLGGDYTVPVIEEDGAEDKGE